jgi:2-haloacid dehalogenase
MRISRKSSGPVEKSNPVIAFDVYGTLIDPFHMEEHLRTFFGEKAREASELWRSKQIEFSFRRALMKKYRDFNVCTAQALSYVGAQLGVTLSNKTQQDLLGQYLQLPAYRDVPGALEHLKTRGLTLVACSNGTEAAVRGLLKRAGVLPRFSKIVSVDKLRTFKPDPAVYEHLAKQVRYGKKNDKKNVWMISSNPFDVIGAKSCGLRTVWVQRDLNKVFDPWEFEPDLVIHTLEELPEKLDFA